MEFSLCPEYIYIIGLLSSHCPRPGKDQSLVPKRGTVAAHRTSEEAASNFAVHHINMTATKTDYVAAPPLLATWGCFSSKGGDTSVLKVIEIGAFQDGPARYETWKISDPAALQGYKSDEKSESVNSAAILELSELFFVLFFCLISNQNSNLHLKVMRNHLCMPDGMFPSSSGFLDFFHIFCISHERDGCLTGGLQDGQPRFQSWNPSDLVAVPY